MASVSSAAQRLRDAGLHVTADTVARLARARLGKVSTPAV